jgi:hypothetical protein
VTSAGFPCRTFLVLRPRDGEADALARYLVDEGVIEAAIPYGLLRGELVEIPDGPDLLVAAVWPSAEHYDSWLAAPERAALLEGMRDLLAPRDGAEGWTVADPAAVAAVVGPLDLSAALGEADPVRRHLVRAGSQVDPVS